MKKKNKSNLKSIYRKDGRKVDEELVERVANEIIRMLNRELPRVTKNVGVIKALISRTRIAVRRDEKSRMEYMEYLEKNKDKQEDKRYPDPDEVIKKEEEEEKMGIYSLW